MGQLKEIVTKLMLLFWMSGMEEQLPSDYPLGSIVKHHRAKNRAKAQLLFPIMKNDFMLRVSSRDSVAFADVIVIVAKDSLK
jgi:hypothetical protein